METQLDKFGRIVIPKTVRDHLGLTTGATLYIEEKNHHIVLTIAEHTPQFKMKNGVVVYMGVATDDFDSAIEDMRDERIDKLSGD